jgi:hypothetical protein
LNGGFQSVGFKTANGKEIKVLKQSIELLNSKFNDLKADISSLTPPSNENLIDVGSKAAIAVNGLVTVGFQTANGKAIAIRQELIEQQHVKMASELELKDTSLPKPESRVSEQSLIMRNQRLETRDPVATRFYYFLLSPEFSCFMGRGKYYFTFFPQS